MLAGALLLIVAGWLDDKLGTSVPWKTALWVAPLLFALMMFVGSVLDGWSLLTGFGEIRDAREQYKARKATSDLVSDQAQPDRSHPDLLGDNIRARRPGGEVILFPR